MLLKCFFKNEVSVIDKAAEFNFSEIQIIQDRIVVIIVIVVVMQVGLWQLPNVTYISKVLLLLPAFPQSSATKPSLAPCAYEIAYLCSI